MRIHLPALLLSLYLVVLPGCSRRSFTPVPSPDGNLVVRASIEQSHADPMAYGCVVIEVCDRSGRVLYRQNAGAIGAQSWNIRREGNARFGMSAIGRNNGYLWERAADGTWMMTAYQVL